MKETNIEQSERFQTSAPNKSRFNSTEKEVQNFKNHLKGLLQDDPNNYELLEITKPNISLISDNLDSFLDRITKIKSHYNTTLVLTYLKTLSDLGKIEELERALQMIFKNDKDTKNLHLIKEFLNMEEESSKLTRLQLDEKIATLLKSLSFDSTQTNRLFINCYLSTKDALISPNLEKNLDLIAWDFENNHPPLTKLNNFDKFLEKFKDHKSFIKLQSNLLYKMQNYPAFFSEIDTHDPRIIIAFQNVPMENYQNIVISNLFRDESSLNKPDILRKYLNHSIKQKSYPEIQKIILKKLEEWASAPSAANQKINYSHIAFALSQDVPDELIPSYQLLNSLFEKTEYFDQSDLPPLSAKINYTLSQMLNHQNLFYRQRALESLIKINPKDPSLKSILLSAIKDTNPEIRSLALIELGNSIHLSDPKIQLIFANLLRDSDESIRNRAANKLRKIRPTNPDVLVKIYEADNSLLNKELGLNHTLIEEFKANNFTNLLQNCLTQIINGK